MGFDIHGRHPTGDEGRHFRRSRLAWPPLAALCRVLVPEICKECRDWTTNDGDGLDGDGAAELAGRLRELAQEGAVNDYICELRSALDKMQPSPCELCRNTGIIPRGLAKTSDLTLGRITTEGDFTCLPCNGTGTVSSLQGFQLLDRSDVEEWIDFLRSCGGFVIR